MIKRISKTRPLKESGFDRFAEKVGKNKIVRGIALGAMLSSIILLETACNGNPPVAEVAPLPNGMATKSPYELVPTTSELTATLAPTLEPTLKPTEVINPFEGLEVCVDWKNPCPATEEDLMSGRLIDFAKSVGQPFPKEAYNTGRFFFFGGSGGRTVYISFVFHDMKNFPPHPEQKLYRQKDSLIVPYRWQMHFSVPNHDGNTYLISVQQWLNPDSSISYLQYVINAIDSENKVEQKIPMTVFEKMGMVMPMMTDFDPGNQNANNLRGFSIADKEREHLIGVWGHTGIIPEKLQYKVLIPLIRTTSYDIKLP